MNWIAFVKKDNLNDIENLCFGIIDELVIDGFPTYDTGIYDVIVSSGLEKTKSNKKVYKTKEKSTWVNINKEKFIFDTKEKALRNLFWRIFK
jgi:hypothetical protein